MLKRRETRGNNMTDKEERQKILRSRMFLLFKPVKSAKRDTFEPFSELVRVALIVTKI